MKRWLKARWAALGYALQGIATMVWEEPHARVHLLATIGVITLGLSLSIERIEWLALVIALGLVWMAEAFSTALEALADACQPEFHPLVKKCKDVAAGAVLLAALTACALAVWIFAPYLR